MVLNLADTGWASSDLDNFNPLISSLRQSGLL